MTKRADGRFPRNHRDFYPTPEQAVWPLLPHLPPSTRFYEPCAGNGSLSLILVRHGHQCVGQSDLYPQSLQVKPMDARELQNVSLGGADVFITNPPWKIPLMHEIIAALSLRRPTWILLYSDWLFTKQASLLLSHASMIIAIGRVRWLPGSPHDGFDNCCWVRFEEGRARPTFIGR